MKKSINPVCFYPAIWLGVLFMFYLDYSYILLEMNNKTLVYLLLSSLLFSMPSLISLDFKNYYSNNYYSLNKLNNTKSIAVFWIFCVIISILVFGLFPIFAIFGFKARRYTDWGFGGFHGLLNAILMSYAIINYGLYLITKTKRHLMIALICFLWPILLMTRQMLMSLFVQYFFVYYYIKGIKIKNILKVILICILVVLLFGLLGNLRDPGADRAFYNLAAPTERYPSFLPSGFLWVYIYLTSPVNNIVYNIDNYPLLQFSVSDAFGGLLPSSVRSLIISRNDTDFALVIEALNVSSSHKNFLAGFGIIGSLFYQIIIGFVITIFYIKYKFSQHIKYCFILAVLSHNVVLSFFVDFFTNLVFLFQIVFIYIFFSKIKLK